MSRNTIIFGISFIAAAVLSFWFLNLLKSVVLLGNFEGQLIIKTAIVFAVWLVAIAINLMMPLVVGGAIMALVMPIIFVILFGFGDMVLLGAAIAAFVVSLTGFIAVSKEKSHRLKLSISSAKKGVSAYFIAALIILTALSYQSIFVDGQLKISEKNIKSLMPFIENQIKSQIPFYTQDMTTDHILVMSAIAKQEIQLSTKSFSAGLQKEIQLRIAKNPAQKAEDILQDPEVIRLIVDDIIKTNPKLVDKLRADYAENFGIKIEKGQSLTATITDIANIYIEKMSAPFKDYLPIVFAATIFFSFKVLEFLFLGIVMFVAGFIFLILKAGGVLRINKTSVMQEYLETSQNKT